MQQVKKIFSQYKNLPKHISNNIVFKAYPKIDKAFSQYGIKDFRKPLPKSNILSEVFKKNLTLVFSTKVKDILTMSMRGITSCQSWGKEQDTCLVGSVADPFCGIIYLTDGVKTKYGERMLLRSIVRIVRTNGKDYLCFEPPYINKKASISSADEKNEIYDQYDLLDYIQDSKFFSTFFTQLPTVEYGRILPSTIINDILDTVEDIYDSNYISYSDKELEYCRDKIKTKYKDPFKI